MNTTPETLSVAGVVLNTLATNIESIAGRMRMPNRRTGNVTVSSRHGAISVPTKKFDENTIELPMWVRGCDPNGAIPSGSSTRKEFQKNVDQLAAIFGQSGLLPVVWTLPDGTVRQCFAEVLDAIDMTTIGVNPLAQFSVSMTVPSTFWEDQAPVQGVLKPATVGINIAAEITAFAGSTAPLEDLTLTIIGPWTNFSIVDVNAGSRVTYQGSLVAFDRLVIDCAQWTAMLNSSSNVLAKLAHTKARFLELQPDVSQKVKILFLGTGETAATQVTFAGKRKFLVGM